MATQVTNNQLDATVAKKWTPYFQKNLSEYLVAKDIANYRTQAELTNGDTVQINRLEDPGVVDYQPGYEYDPENVNASGETLTIDQNQAIFVSLEDIQTKQSVNNIEGRLMTRMAYKLRQSMDANVLSYVDQGYHKWDDAGSPLDLGSTSIQDILMDAQADIERRGTTDGEESFVLVADPKTVSAIKQNIVADGFKEADKALVNAFQGTYLGIKLYKSTNLPATQDFTLDADAADGDVFKVGGVTFKFVSSLGTDAGEVLIDGTAAGTAENLKQAINGETSSDYNALSEKDRKALDSDRIAATIDTATLTLTGAGHMAVSTTVIDGSHTLGSETIKHYFGRPRGIDFAMQIAPRLEMTRSDKRFANIYKMQHLYGIQVFEDGADKFGSLNIKG